MKRKLQQFVYTQLSQFQRWCVVNAWMEPMPLRVKHVAIGRKPGVHKQHAGEIDSIHIAFKENIRFSGGNDTYIFASKDLEISDMPTIPAFLRETVYDPNRKNLEPKE